MKKVAMLGSGFIGRFYADSLQGYRAGKKVPVNLRMTMVATIGQ